MSPWTGLQLRLSLIYLASISNGCKPSGAVLIVGKTSRELGVGGLVAAILRPSGLALVPAQPVVPCSLCDFDIFVDIVCVRPCSLLQSLSCAFIVIILSAYKRSQRVQEAD